MSSQDASLQNEPVHQRQIQWYPGHMAKALRQVTEKLKQVDIVVEVRDARSPLASGNAKLAEVLGQKKRLVVCNKANLADPAANEAWRKHFAQSDQPVLFLNCLDNQEVRRILPQARQMMKESWERFKNKGIKPPPLRLMVVGLPNTGKSTLINRLTKRSATKTGDRPGITRNQEWVKLDKDCELLDTPGIMPPSQLTEEAGLGLCAIFAIKDEIPGAERVARYLAQHLLQAPPAAMQERYKILGQESPEALFQQIAQACNLLGSGGEPDWGRVYQQFLQDFRKGLLGRTSFEWPPSTVEPGL